MYAIDYLASRQSTPTAPTLTEITPADARKMLERSTSFNNRRVTKSVVREYADSIARKEWNHAIGDPIRIDTHDRVIDGQHRLLAVIEANVPQMFYVISNLPPESVSYMDIGRPRSHSDMIGMTGAPLPRALAAGIRWLSRYENGTLSNQRAIVPRHRVVEYLREHPGLVRSSDVANTVKDILRRTGVAVGAHYLFSRIDEAQADEFYDKLRTGLGLTATDPVYRLRERLIDPWRPLSELECGAVVIKAWNITRRGGKIERLYWTAAKEDFPTPV